MELLNEALKRLEQGEAVDFNKFPLESLLEAGREDFYYLTDQISRLVEARLGIPPRLAGNHWSEFWNGEISVQQMLDRLRPEVLCREVLGYKGPRTVRLFRVAPKERIEWARHLALEKEDYIQKILEKPSIPFRWWICRLLVESFSEPVRIRLVQTPTEILDEVEMFFTQNNFNYEEVKQLKRVRNWEDLLAGLRWLLDTRETRLPINPHFRSVDGARVGEFTLKLPKTTNQLVEAGKALGNCLGSYASYIRGGHIIILVEDNTSTLAYALEIYRNSVQQFVGHGNEEAPVDVKEPILRFLLEKGLIKN